MRGSIYISPSDQQLKDIAENLKKAREHCGYSYQQLADKTGLNKSTLQRYETGAIRNLPLGKLEVLASALSMKPADLLGLQAFAAGEPSYQHPALELLSYLGYEVEATVMNSEDRFSLELEGHEIEENDADELFWIRSRRDNVCHKVSFEQIERMMDAIRDFAEYVAYRAVQGGETIQRPERWYRVIDEYEV